MDIWVLSIVWLLLIVLLSTLGCMCPFKSAFLYTLDKSLVVQLLTHRVALFFNFLRNLQSSCTSLHPHQQWKRVPLSPYPHQHLLYLVLLILAIVTGVRWYVIVVVICISLMISNVDIFSCVCLPSGCLHWKSVYWCLLPISSLDYLLFGCWVW